MKAGLPKLLNSFVRHTAVSFTSCRPVSKIGNQGMSARDEIFVSWGFDESSRKAHGVSPTKCTGCPSNTGSYPTMLTSRGASQQIWMTDVAERLDDIRFTLENGHYRITRFCRTGEIMPTIKPALHHVTMKTSHLDEMITWYALLIGAKCNSGTKWPRG